MFSRKTCLSEIADIWYFQNISYLFSVLFNFIYGWISKNFATRFIVQKIGTCTFVLMFYFLSQNLPRHTEIISRISWFKHCWYFLVLIVIYFNLGNLGQFLIDYRGNNISASHLMIELFQNKMAASIAAPLAGNYFYSPFISSERSSPAHSSSSVASSTDRRLQIYSNIITRFNS